MNYGLLAKETACLSEIVQNQPEMGCGAVITHWSS